MELEPEEGHIHCKLHNRIHRIYLVEVEGESSNRLMEVDQNCFGNCKDKVVAVLDCSSKQIDRTADNLDMTSSRW